MTPSPERRSLLLLGHKPDAQGYRFSCGSPGVGRVSTELIRFPYMIRGFVMLSKLVESQAERGRKTYVTARGWFRQTDTYGNYSKRHLDRGHGVTPNSTVPICSSTSKKSPGHYLAPRVCKEQGGEERLQKNRQAKQKARPSRNLSMPNAWWKIHTYMPTPRLPSSAYRLSSENRHPVS